MTPFERPSNPPSNDLRTGFERGSHTHPYNPSEFEGVRTPRWGSGNPFAPVIAGEAA
jgi:hypothetical protein